MTDACISQHDRLRLALEVQCSWRTVDRWIDDPEQVATVTRYALESAACKLGIVTAPESTTDNGPDAA
jgi:hypothetical protein